MHARHLYTCLLTLGVVQSPAIAQTKSSRDYDVTLAEQIVKQAEEISDLTRHVERAKLFEQASNLFPPSDPRSVNALFMAAHVWYYTGKFKRAKELLEIVATRAEQQGNLKVAGDSYISALVIAAERGDRNEARRLMDRVIVLASTPAMPEDQRVALLQRVKQPLATLAAGPR